MATIDLLTEIETSGTCLSAQHGQYTGGHYAHINALITQVNANTTALAGASNPFNYVGSIAVAASFPTSALVTQGDVYTITADVTDNDATKTNTSLSFLAGSDIFWDGSTWKLFGPNESEGIVSMATTPYTLAAGVHTVLVDTATIAGASVIDLPALSGVRNGRELVVIDIGGAAETYPIAVTPNGADQIDNIAAAKSVDQNDGALRIVTEGTGWYTGPSHAAVNSHAAITTNPHGKARAASGAIDMVTPAANPITLGGTAAQHFLPESLVFYCSAGAALNGDVTLTVGTSVGGTEIMAAVPLTGLDTASESFRIALTGVFPAILGNAALDITVTIGDTGGGATGSMTAYIEGDLV